MTHLTMGHGVSWYFGTILAPINTSWIVKMGLRICPLNEVVNFPTGGRKREKRQADRFGSHFSDRRMYVFIVLYSDRLTFYPSHREYQPMKRSHPRDSR